MDTKETASLRSQLAEAMHGDQAHIAFASAISDFPVEASGEKPGGAPHTAWQLLEHMRIAQHDILEFSRNPQHQSPPWPEGYWPKTEAPPDDNSWGASVKAFESDSKEMEKLVRDAQQALFTPFAHGDGQNLMREALLIATHNSYHLGQLVFLKKMLKPA
ncbi:MAG: DinB family protein [Acidobacteriaceae bacterium]|nr:DinB family protein [Acidobacteriaceae bacterium]